jgi:sodium transport system permease protein
MKYSNVLLTSRTVRLALKELREILRDRRTIMTLVLMPLLVYPLLGVMVKRGLLSSLETVGSTAIRVAIESPQEVAVFRRQLDAGESLLPVLTTKTPENPLATLAEATGDSKQAKVECYSPAPTSSLEAEVRSGRADLGVQLEPTGVVHSVRWGITYRPESRLSADAHEYIVTRLKALNERYLRDTLAAEGLRVRLPADIDERVVSSQAPRPTPLITFVPLVLVLMTMTGAVYPAIDLTAGERERGTMEILIAAPVSRMTVLAGKFVAVMVVALLTASVNMLAMFATLFTLGLDSAILGDSGLKVIPLVILMMVVFAGFFSAVLLSITSVARSFKEAQAYLIPLMLLSLTPGMFSLMPDLQMGPVLAVTPLVNIVLTGRDLLQGHFSLLMFTVVILCTTFYGVLALAVAARVFGSDSVLYGSSGSWTELLRAASKRRRSAPSSAAALSLAIVFPLFIVVGSLPARLGQTFDLPLSQVLLFNIGVFLIVFVAVPLVFLRLSGVIFSSGLSLSLRMPLSSIAVALLFGFSMWAVLYELNLVVGIASHAESLRRSLEALVDDLQRTPLWVKLAALALAPALCEELYFRGFLQTSLRQRYSPVVAIALSSVLFGLFHIVVRDHLFLERMIPSTLMGVILGTLLERSGSVIPGMILHALHNGLLLCVVHYQPRLEQLGVGLQQRSHLPTAWLATSFAMALVAGVLLWRTKPIR